MDINIVIVIRFSLKTKYRQFQSKNERLIWMNKRLKIFNDFTVESIQGLNYKPALILVLFDVDDRDFFESKFKEHIKIDVLPIFSDYSNIHNEISFEIRRAKLKNNVLISRLDSDDIILPNYYDSIINNLSNNPYDSQYFVLTHGARYGNNLINYIKYSNSPFISLFVKEYNNESVYNMPHGHIYSHNPIYLDELKWIQLIHGDNVSNGISKTIFSIKNVLKILLNKIFMGNNNRYNKGVIIFKVIYLNFSTTKLNYKNICNIVLEFKSK